MADPERGARAQALLSHAQRYGLAFVSVACALLVEIVLSRLGVGHSFTAFGLSAIAITFWYAGTRPGIVAVLLAMLIRSSFFEPESSSLSRSLYTLAYVVFAVLMSLIVRRRRDLEAKVAARTAELTAANEDLRKQKDHLDVLLDLAPDAIAFTDDDFRVIRLNKEFTRVFGYTPEEAIGRTLPDLIVPAELRDSAIRNKELIVSGERVALEYVRQRKDGVRIFTSAVAGAACSCRS